jgi:membrane-bound lytic murein transglycosylase D
MLIMRRNNNNIRLLLLLSVFAIGVSGCNTVPATPDTNSVDVATTASPATAPETPAATASAQEPSENEIQYTDLWQRIRKGFSLPDADSPLVARHEQWFAQNPEYVERLVDRARLYLYYIVEEVEKRDMPMEIALLPAIESAYKPHALSRARAAGLWQFIPSTGRHFGLDRNWWYDGRRDVVAATDAALDYLGKLHEMFEGDWHLALAAYNAGERRVMGAQGYNKRRGRSERYEDLSTLKAETRNYVPKLIAFAHVVAEPEKFGLKLAAIPNEPYFAQVEIGSQIDLGVVARLANISIGDLYDINPAFNRWATSPDGPHRLLVPAERQEALLAALESLPENQRTRWIHHRVRGGETLSHIASRYNVSVSAIQQGNRLRGSWIRAGQDLIIPVSSRSISAAQANVTRPVARKPQRLEPPAGAVSLVHRVESGDTLWAIARRYDVYIYQLTGWNGISRYRPLRPGQELKLWVQPDQARSAMNEDTGSRS